MYIFDNFAYSGSSHVRIVSHKFFEENSIYIDRVQLHISGTLLEYFVQTFVYEFTCFTEQLSDVGILYYNT